MVDPRGSEWFSWFSPAGDMVPLNQTRLYTEDWIGLRALDTVSPLYTALCTLCRHCTDTVQSSVYSTVHCTAYCPGYCTVHCTAY